MRTAKVKPMPRVIVFAGPNGAGKSTCADAILAKFAIETFVKGRIGGRIGVRLQLIAQIFFQKVQFGEIGVRRQLISARSKVALKAKRDKA